jgi:hypothetical protein
MPDYQKGKIYKITSGDLTYIGSTCEPTLARRLAGHVGDYKQWKKGNRDKVNSFILIETGQYEITLIELFPCGSRDELNARERFHIETNVCVNKVIPCRTPKEYRETHTEEKSTRMKDYYQVNKEFLKERSKSYKEENKEKIKETKRLYREANKDKIKEYKKEHYQKNKSS